MGNWKVGINSQSFILKVPKYIMFIILYVSWYVIRNINMFISLMYITQNVSWYVIRKIKCVSLYVTMYVILSITQNVSWFMIHTLYVLGHFFPRLFFF